MQSLRDLLLRHPFGSPGGGAEAARVQHATDTGDLHRPPVAPTPPAPVTSGSADPEVMPSSPAQAGPRSPMVQFLYERGIADLNSSAGAPQGMVKVRRKDPDDDDPDPDPEHDFSNGALLAALLAGKAGIVAGSLGAFNGGPSPDAAAGPPAPGAISGVPASPLLP